MSDLPVRQNDSAVGRTRLRVVMHRHSEIGPSHPRPATHQPPVHVAVLALHSDRNSTRCLRARLRTELRYEVVEVRLGLRHHLEHAHLLRYSSFDERRRVANCECRHIESFTDEPGIAELVLGGEKDPARVVVAGYQRVEEYSALTE